MKKTNIHEADSDKAKKDLIKLLKAAEDHLQATIKSVAELRDSHEFPYMVNEIKKQIADGKVKTMSASWVQRKFKVGYARAMRLMDQLEEERVIKKN